MSTPENETERSDVDLLLHLAGGGAPGDVARLSSRLVDIAQRLTDLEQIEEADRQRREDSAKFEARAAEWLREMVATIVASPAPAGGIGDLGMGLIVALYHLANQTRYGHLMGGVAAGSIPAILSMMGSSKLDEMFAGEQEDDRDPGPVTP